VALVWVLREMKTEAEKAANIIANTITRGFSTVECWILFQRNLLITFTFIS